VADRLLCLQQAAGNRAVASAVASDGGVRVQRDPPTRAENIAALKRELAAAKGTAPSGDEWKYVAYRLNGFDEGDFQNVMSLIPAGELKDARSAVRIHLAGWPSQKAILKALDTQGSKRVKPWRPLGLQVWEAYNQIGYNVFQGEDKTDGVWNMVGGSVGKKYGPNNQTCGARLSWALNRAGAPVTRGEQNKPGVKYHGTPGDGMSYVVWTPTFIGYLKSTWGPADLVLHNEAERLALEASLGADEVAVFVNDKGAHTGLIKHSGYKDPYLWSEMPAFVWKLP